MIFGKIDYLNLLPFDIFIKRYARSSRFKQTLHYKRGVPSALNRAFASRNIDAAFISSITAQKCKHFGIGIVAKKEVLSVLAIPSDSYKKDSESATSNLLAQVLDIDAEVIIGDKALQYYYRGGEHIDLGKLWSDKTSLPFVFALLCTHNNKEEIKKISRNFSKKRIFIPYYIIKKESQKRDLSIEQVKHYLKHISYSVGTKELRGYKRFLHEAKNRQILPSLREIRMGK